MSTVMRECIVCHDDFEEDAIGPRKRASDGIPEGLDVCDGCRDCVRERKLGISRRANGIHIVGIDKHGDEHPRVEQKPQEPISRARHATATGRFAEFSTANGATFVVVESIIGVSPPVKKPKMPQSRVLNLTGGHRVFVLDSAENLKKLGIVLTARAAAQETLPARGRGRPRKLPQSSENSE